MHIQSLYIHFTKPLAHEKNVTTAPSSKLCLQKIFQYNIAKLVYCMQFFLRFHATESDKELLKKFWMKRNSIAPY